MNVIITVIKFFHILCATVLMGSLFYSLVQPVRKILLRSGILAGLSGTLLVYVSPAYYSFHTPWIRAAFFLLAIFLLAVILFFPQNPEKRKITLPILSSFLLVLLGIIMHDAITKQVIWQHNL